MQGSQLVRPQRWLLAGVLALLLAAASAVAVARPSTGRSGIERTQRVEAVPVAQLQAAPAEGEPEPIPEAPAFSRDGDTLYWVTVWGYQGHSLWTYDLETGDTAPMPLTHPEDPDYRPAFPAVVVHQDGTLFAADFANQRVVTIDPSTGVVSDLVTVDDVETEYFAPDDLVFDSDGNLYITDLQGDPTDPRGRVYRLSAAGELTLLSDGIAAPNGIALSPDERHLWVAEYHANRLLRIGLTEEGLVDSQFWADIIEVVANFGGPGLSDSNTVDSAGNVYQAFFKGGRAVVLAQTGEQIAQIELAGGSEDYLLTTNLVIEPEGTTGYLVAGGAGGARLYEFEALADGVVPYSHQ